MSGLSAPTRIGTRFTFRSLQCHLRLLALMAGCRRVLQARIIRQQMTGWADGHTL